MKRYKFVFGFFVDASNEDEAYDKVLKELDSMISSEGWDVIAANGEIIEE